MKIYTKRGDSGQTDLFGGSRVLKNSQQVRAYGAVDNANAALGFAAAEKLPEELNSRIGQIMGRLFDLGAELSTTDSATAHKKRVERMGAGVELKHVAEIEAWIDEAERSLKPLKSFILPTGCDAACRMHLARSAIRQAEIEVLAHDQTQKVRPEILQFLNRLSDLLFVWARFCNAQNKIADQAWIKSA